MTGKEQQQEGIEISLEQAQKIVAENEKKIEAEKNGTVNDEAKKLIQQHQDDETKKLIQEHQTEPTSALDEPLTEIQTLQKQVDELKDLSTKQLLEKDELIKSLSSIIRNGNQTGDKQIEQNDKSKIDVIDSYSNHVLGIEKKESK